MDTNNPIILEVYDITWDQYKQESTDLPKELKLQWIKKDWNKSEVSDWLSEYFKVKINNIKINELDEQPGSG